MKKILLTLSLSLLILVGVAQPPALINYQGIARNSISNAVLVNQTITLQLSILTGSSTGTALYSEVRKVTTNGYGLFNCRIGDPIDRMSFTGSITNINWIGFPTGEPKYLKVEIDPTGHTNFVFLGTS